MLGPVEHADVGQEFEQLRPGDRGRDLSADPALLGRTQDLGPALGQLQRRLEGMHPGQHPAVLGGRLFLRPSPAPRAEGPDRSHPHLVGRHAGRGLDQPRGAERECRDAGCLRRLGQAHVRPAQGPGQVRAGQCRVEEGRRGGQGRRQARAETTARARGAELAAQARRLAQRDDHAADPLRDQRRALVPGRIECRSADEVPHPVAADDRRLAPSVGRGRLPLLHRAARQLHEAHARTHRHQLGGTARSAVADHRAHAQDRHRGGHRHR